MHLDGSVAADWVSGIGSLLAVAVALWFSAQETRERRRERLASVTMWAENSGDPSGWKLVAVNDTAQPIFSWSCLLDYEAPEGHIAEVLRHIDVGILPPGRFEFPWQPTAALLQESNVIPTLAFRDASGGVWMRSPMGALRHPTSRELNSIGFQPGTEGSDA